MSDGDGAPPGRSRAMHVAGKPSDVSSLLEALEAGMVDIGHVQEVFTKTYIGFECPGGGFASVLVQNSKLTLYARVPFASVPPLPGARMRDVAGIGHHGYGDTEYSIFGEPDLEGALEVANAAYHLVSRTRKRRLRRGSL